MKFRVIQVSDKRQVKIPDGWDICQYNYDEKTKNYRVLLTKDCEDIKEKRLGFYSDKK